jgi:hypothetical protein
MLTKDGGLVGDEEVDKIIATNGNRRDLDFGELLDLRQSKEDKLKDGGVNGTVTMGNSEASMMVDLLNLEMTSDGITTTKDITAVFELLNFDTETMDPNQAVSTDVASLVDISRPSPTLTTPSIATTPSTPSHESISTNVTTLSTPTNRVQTRSKGQQQLLITPATPPRAEHKPHSSLLILEEESNEGKGGALDDLAGLSPSFHSYTINELSGLDFSDQTTSTTPIPAVSDVYSQIRDLFITNNTSQISQETSIQTDLEGLTFPTISLACKPYLKDFQGVEGLQSKDEAIVFQGRRTRKSTPDGIDTATIVDSISADRAFRMFSAGIKKC